VRIIVEVQDLELGRTKSHAVASWVRAVLSDFLREPVPVPPDALWRVVSISITTPDDAFHGRLWLVGEPGSQPLGRYTVAVPFAMFPYDPAGMLTVLRIARECAIERMNAALDPPSAVVIDARESPPGDRIVPARNPHPGGARVTDYTPDTPMVARLYCPGCEPEADPSAEILDVLWCEPHLPARAGADDAAVNAAAYLSGGAEAGGDDNRRWCHLIHGARPAR
jgi:hypothetical protein